MEEKILYRKTKYKAGLGNIYRYIRSLKEFEGLGDCIIYKSIIVCLRKNNIEVSDRSIVRHFKDVSIEQYEASEKTQILNDLKSIVTLKERSETAQKSPISNLVLRSDIRLVI